jgi:hypothetical protein
MEKLRMKWLVFLFFVSQAHAQILMREEPTIPGLKPPTFENLMTCSKSLEKISSGSGKVTPCGFVLDSYSIGKPGVFIYTAPDTLYFIETAENGKFSVALPSGEKEGEPHKLFFEVKDKSLGTFVCDGVPADAADYSEKEATKSTYFDYRTIYSMVLGSRIRTVKRTFEAHKKVVQDRKKTGSREQDLKVDPYVDGLNPCTNIRNIGMIASSEQSLLPKKIPVPAKILTQQMPPSRKGPKTGTR